MTGPDNRDALREALKRSASALKAAGVPFALAGSYALWVRGAPESEHDVDFVVAEDDTERAAQALTAAGLTILRPPEDWLFKADVDGVLVDVLHRQAGVAVTPELLNRAEVIEVLSIRMPVLDATDLMASKLQVLAEHYCDFGAVLPAIRAVREQLDWPRLRKEVAGNEYANALLFLTDRLGISPAEDED
ncbi:MAG TPA: nucleotidyltransferase [Jatrophihabitantaceae bacterium]|nr:nucleotidyltransferase [Jatrophihabitantaceae bacterium]